MIMFLYFVSFTGYVFLKVCDDTSHTKNMGGSGGGSGGGGAGGPEPPKKYSVS